LTVLISLAHTLTFMFRKITRSALLVAATIAGLQASAQSTGTVYFSSGTPNTQLYRLTNPGTASVSGVTIGSAYSGVYNGLSYYNGTLYAISSTGNVVNINPATGAVTGLGVSLPGNHNYASGDVYNGTFYTTNMDGNSHTLYKVNLSNNTYTSVSVANGYADIVYYNGNLYAAAGFQGSYYVYRINPANGAETAVGGGVQVNPSSAAWGDGTGMIYFNGGGTYNVNSDIATQNSSVGTGGTGVAGEGSGADDATWSPVSQNTDLTNGGTIAGSASGCSPFDPSNITSTAAASGGNGPGAIQYRWWANGSIISGATSSTYDPGPITTTTTYQREANRTGTTAWVASNQVVMTAMNCSDVTNGGTVGFGPSVPNDTLKACGPNFDPPVINNIADATGGSGGVIEYRWWRDGALISGANSASYDPPSLSVGSYRYQREARRSTSNWNGVGSNNVWVVVVTSPTASVAVSGAAGENENCHTGAVTLTASGASSYAWSTGATTASITVNPTANTTYTVTTSNSGCANTATASKTVQPAIVPVVAVSAGAPACAGSQVTLTANGGDTYAWSDGATGATHTVTAGTANQTYTVTASKAGCTITGSSTVTVYSHTCGSDLSISMEMMGTSLLPVGGSTAFNIYIENVMSTATPGVFSFNLSKPSGPSGLAVTIGSSPLWTVTSSGTMYMFTSTSPLAGNSSVAIPVTISRTGGTAGTFSFSTTITNADDTNSGNNNASVSIKKL
jgi:hypothetical protein